MWSDPGMYDIVFTAYGPIGDWDVSQVTDMNGLFWGTDFNDNINDWSLHSTRDADEEDQFMQLMDMGDDMDIGVPPITKST